MKIVITNNSIMYNRGSEAVIRSVVDICRFWHPGANITVSTGSYGEVLKEISGASKVVPRFDSNGRIDCLLSETKNADIVLVTGADNYEYGDESNKRIAEVNDQIIRSTNAKTILYDLSLASENMSKDVFDDIKRFSLFTTRESETYKVFCKAFNENKVKLYSDPAFILPMEKTDMPFGFEDNNTVGINISKLIMGRRFGISKEMVINNYKLLINYLLSNTSFKITILQHVINNGFDLDAAWDLYDGYEKESRVTLLQSECLNAMQVKYIISRLRMLITSRTHASIAAYSTNVPSFVLGYSIKSIGIAKDIFGKWDDYVLPVRSITKKEDLVNSCKYILDNENAIRKQLERTMPAYKMSAIKFGECLF